MEALLWESGCEDNSQIMTLIGLRAGWDSSNTQCPTNYTGECETSIWKVYPDLYKELQDHCNDSQYCDTSYSIPNNISIDCKGHTGRLAAYIIIQYQCNSGKYSMLSQM